MTMFYLQQSLLQDSVLSRLFTNCKTLVVPVFKKKEAHKPQLALQKVYFSIYFSSANVEN